ncbi:MAG: phenylalanine--tRNA ligase subunit alpha [Alphaproteobacteria bacterium]|nr:phenylalanine--tRNA ligase subunit alpha [Alphaproteobacteria bacterium]
MKDKINQTSNLEDLKSLYDSVFGKNGTMTMRLKGMRDLDNDARAALNSENTELRTVFKTRESELQDAEIMQKMEMGKLDATAPFESDTDFGAGKLHPLTQSLAEMEAAFEAMGYSKRTGPEIESDYYNFEMLNFIDGHPARDMQDTFFVEGGNLLRTHTSPVQIRAMQSEGAPIKIYSPGPCYRVDTFSVKHSPAFRQIEWLHIDKDITMTDFMSDIKTFLNLYFGRNFDIRLRPSYFPFTEPSIEFDAEWKPGEWMEMGGAGFVHPQVLRNCGVNPDEFQGHAGGPGFERLTMLKYGLMDIRKFFDGDVRWIRANGF